MTTVTRSDFLTTRAWHRAVVGDTDFVLRHTSALEFLELFGGYINEKTIEVYATQPGDYDNIDYYIVESFDDIDYLSFDNVLCTSIDQTFNDMIFDFDNIDEQALVEGLSRYYYINRKSFNGLEIRPENIERFNSIKDWVIEYYSGGY